MGRGARWRSVLAGTGLAAVLVAAQGVSAGPAAGAVPTGKPPVLQKTSKLVTADALPTVQVDGVVWSQVVVGSTVYAAGEFTTARPAAGTAGTPVARKNLLAYSITTGKLKTTFKPGALNGQVRTLARSADGKTIYAGGDFTLVGKSKRSRFAAFDAATGALRSIAPAFNGTVSAITVRSSVYVGGSFTAVGTTKRSRLAAVSASTGKPTGWAPKADRPVKALVATPDKTKIVVGGSFATLNSTAAPGMGAVDAKTGASRTWKVNKVVKDYGTKAAIMSLAADGDTVYGSGYAYGAGNFEGAFAVNPADGAIRWLQDCHGDTYSVAPVGSTVYVVGHAHMCSNIGAFPESSPRSWYRALAMTKTARGTVATNTQRGANYANFAGHPAPSLYNWFPALNAGTYTGMGQGAWNVVGTSTYVAAAGEFTAVNGAAQQGLVRFAVPTSAPNRQGPVLAGASVAPQATASGADAATVSWTTNYDWDDKSLSYLVLRNGQEVYRTPSRVVSLFWARSQLSWTDQGLAPGTYSYRIQAVDPNGNTTTSPATKVTVPAPPPEPTPTPTEPAPPVPPEPAPAAG